MDILYYYCINVLKQALVAGEEVFSKYDVAFNKDGMKSLLKTALNIGHFFSGKSKADFVADVKPYLKAASKVAEKVNFQDLVGFSFQ